MPQLEHSLHAQKIIQDIFLVLNVYKKVILFLIIFPEIHNTLRTDEAFKNCFSTRTSYR